MSQQAQSIDRVSLLAIANKLIAGHEHYFPGMQVDDVSQKDDVLVFRGEYFLDDNGLPTGKSTTVFNLLKFLAVELSPRYRLVE